MRDAKMVFDCCAERRFQDVVSTNLFLEYDDEDNRDDHSQSVTTANCMTTHFFVVYREYVNMFQAPE